MGTSHARNTNYVVRGLGNFESCDISLNSGEERGLDY